MNLAGENEILFLAYEYKNLCPNYSRILDS